MKAVFSQFCLAALICVYAGTFDRAQAQYTKYQPGDRVEVMYSGRWQPGTVMPLAKNDLNRTGSKYRVKIDSVPDYLKPEGTEIMIEDMRSGGAPTAGNEGGGTAGGGAQVQQTGGATPQAASQYGSFKPGDRVEAIWNGRKVTGTVVPLLANDLNKTGSKIRVKIDGLADYLQPEGTEIMAVDAKHTNAAVNKDNFRNGLPAAWNPGKAPIPQGGKAPAKPAEGAPAGEYVGKSNAGKPKMMGNVPDLSGTAWKMLFDRAVHVVPVLYFRKTGRYETVQLAAGMQGNYRQNGSRLTLEKDTYNMTFDPATNILRLDADGDKLKLLYDGPTAR